MAITGWSLTDFLQAAALWPGQSPFGFSVWYYIPTGVDPTGNNMTGLGQQGTANNHWAQSFNPDFPTFWRKGDGGSTTAAIATAEYPFDTWAHHAAAEVSDSLGEVWHNGANKGTDTAAKTYAGTPDITVIGMRAELVSPIPATMGVGSFSVWDLAGFSEADRNAWAAELASGANPNDMDADVGQPWEGALVAYSTLLDLTAPSLGSFTEQGSLSVFASHPPVNGEGSGLPNSPTLVADPTSWDAVHLTATENGSTDSIEIFRSTTSPVDPQTDPIVATLVPDGQAFDDNRVPNTTYFYLAVAKNVSGDTNGTEQEALTWTDDAIETFVNNDSIEIPFDIPSGERATEIRLKAGTAIRDLSVAAGEGSIVVEVRDQSAAVVGSQVFNNLLNDSEEELDDLVVFLSPQPIGPQTITVTYTSAIDL